MLLRLGIANHLSIRDRQEVSLVASSLSDRMDGLIRCASAPTGSVLPAVLVYGANASGKSNLVGAIRTMREMIRSHTKFGVDDGVPDRHPFRLDGESATTPSCFEMDFVLSGVRHHYGFEATQDAFVREWLLDYPSRRARTLFERAGTDFRFGRGLKGRNRLIADLTRANSLFVSAGAQNGHEKLAAVFSYFAGIRGVAGSSVSGPSASAWLVRGRLDDRVLAFLREAETGVVGHRQRTERLADDDDVAIELAHRGTGGDVFLELERESAGTRRLLVVLTEVFRALDDGSPVVIDELDGSLHTQAALAVVELFCSRSTNPHGAQLIATLHDTNLLSTTVLRRDQVWFAEKDRRGATVIYPLTDIRTRKGDNLELGYLQRRYGATPRRLSTDAFAPSPG